MMGVPASVQLAKIFIILLLLFFRYLTSGVYKTVCKKLYKTEAEISGSHCIHPRKGPANNPTVKPEVVLFTIQFL